MLDDLIVLHNQLNAAVHKENVARSVVGLGQGVEEHGHQRSAQLLGAVADKVLADKQRPVFRFGGFFRGRSDSAAVAGEGDVEVAVLGLHAGLIALALRQTFQIFNRGLIVNGDNKGGVAGVDFLLCHNDRHWAGLAQRIYELIHKAQSFRF